MNTIVSDVAGLVSLSSNQFTLPAGRYRIKATAPSYAVSRNSAILYNITDSEEAMPGKQSYNVTGCWGQSEISGVFTITAPKVFEIRHMCQTTKTTNGLGISSYGSVSIFTEVELWKEA